MLLCCVLLLLVSCARAAQVCCPDIGCFTDNAPFNGQPLPSCIDKITPKYTLFTRSNRNSGQVVTTTSVPSVYKGSVRTVIITHGWQNDGNEPFLTSMKNAFLDREDINVVVLDWGRGTSNLWYPQCAANTRTVGAYTALIINSLVKKGGSGSRMWCTGHSLGSHVCGHAGMKTSIQRITGMDPAGPWFQDAQDRTVGLNPTSARLVDVIHSDNTYGTLRNLGHIDFYPNGGKNQPGCINYAAQNGAEAEQLGFIGCSHGRAVDFMIESIKKDCFLSRSKCTNYNSIPGSCTTCATGTASCAIMGYGADKGSQKAGLFYLTATKSAPYCTN